MKKIVLIYPDTHNIGPNLMAPLSLLYIATPLTKKIEFKIIDQRVDKEWRKTLQNYLNSNDIVCFGISSMTGPQISGGIAAAAIIKKYLPHVPIVWGGVHASLLPEETIKSDFVNIIVIGDGEETFRELVEVLIKGGDKKNVKGIIYKDGDLIVRTPKRGRFSISKLGDLAYDLMDMEKYKSSPLWTERKSLPIITSRGCPHRCTYCYNTEFSQKRWTALSPEETVASIIHLVHKYDISSIFLLDDNFFVNLNRVRRICELLIEKNLNIRIYNANCRVDSIVRMDQALLNLTKIAGFNQLFIGVESGSNKVLDKINKDITVEQVLVANKKLKNAGIRPFYSFMAGFPFETIEDIKMTLFLMNLLLKENQDAIVYRLNLFTPFPGTVLFDMAAKLGMNFPKTFDGWANYHYDRLNYKGFSAHHRKFLENFHYYTSFLDKKLRMDRAQYIKILSNLYSKILSFRIENGFYSSLYEFHLLKMAQSSRHRSLP